MNEFIEKLFEKISTRKYLRNINSKEIEIYIRNDNVNDEENDNNENEKRSESR